MAAQRFHLHAHPAAAVVMALLSLAPGVIQAGPKADPRATTRPAAHAPVGTARAHAPAPLRNAGLSTAIVRPRGAFAVPGARNALRINPVAKSAPQVLPGHTAAAPALGGPARFDAKKGAAIGGTLMRHKP